MKKAAIYARVSTAEQHIESQLYDLRQLAAQRGLEVVKEYARLATLTAYGADIFVVSPDAHLPLWSAQGGYEQTGLDYLVEMRKQQHEQKRRALKRGDRVAIFRRGIAVVKMVDYGQVCAVLCNQTFIEMPRKQITWNEQNNRWEADCAKH